MSKITKTKTFSQVEIREENGFVFYRPKFKKDWYASGPEICKGFGSKNPAKASRQIWKRHQVSLEINSVLIEIPTKIIINRGLQIEVPLDDKIKGKNLQLVRCYNKKGAWFFSSKIGTPEADAHLVKLFDSYDRLIRIKAPKTPALFDARQYGKTQRLGLTDAIQLFVEYATHSGSKGASHYYKIITQKVHKHLFDVHGRGTPENFRDSLTRIEIQILGIVEERLEDLLRDGMDQGWHYKDIVIGIDAVCTNGRECLTFSEPRQITIDP